MNLEELIQEGEQLEGKVKDNGMGYGKTLEGIELETWSSKVVLFMERNSPNRVLSDKVEENVEDLSSKGYEKYQAILGVLKAMNEME